MSRTAVWYFDVISPYAYLHFKRFRELPADLEITCRPVLFAGLLKHWGTKGPAELPAKRIHTYRQSVWLAAQQGAPFRMPDKHPFNPLRALRLLIALGAPRAAVATTLDFIWGEGLDVDTDWPTLCARLGVAADTPLVDEPAVKAALSANTNEAIAAGVWGVPSFLLDGELFWGADSVGMMNDFLAKPDLCRSPAMRRADGADVGVMRRLPGAG